LWLTTVMLALATFPFLNSAMPAARDPEFSARHGRNAQDAHKQAAAGVALCTPILTSVRIYASLASNACPTE